MSALFWALFGSILTLASGISLRWWQYRRDMWLGDSDRFCKSCQELANEVTDYWVSSEAAPDEAPKNIAREARILGQMTKVDGYWAHLGHRLLDEPTKSALAALASLTDCATGGNFQVRGREIDVERARSVQISAAQVEVAVRHATRMTMTIGGAVRQRWETSRRLQPDDP